MKTVKEEDIEKKGLNENEGDIEESQASMVIDEDVDSDSQYEMENEKDLSDSEIESDLEEEIVFGKLFDFSRVLVFIVLTVLIKKCLIFCFENNKKKFITRLNFCVLFIYFLFATHTN